MSRLLRRALPALIVAGVLAASLLAPSPSFNAELVKHCSGYGYSYKCPK